MKKTIQVIILFFAIGFSSFAQTVDLQKGLVAYYPFNGNANDESGNGNNGTVYGATLTTDRFGNNGAYCFDGINDYIDVNFGIELKNSSFVFTLWAKHISSGSLDYFLSMGPGGKTNHCIDFGFRDKNNIIAAFWSDDLVTSKQYNDKDWHMWSLIYNKETGNRYIYRDYSLIASNTAKPYIANGKLRIGDVAYAFMCSYSGKIDDIRIYNRAISEAEIKALYNDQGKIVTDNIPPEITITYPDVSCGFKPVEQNKQITIQGNAKDASGIFEVLVNGQEAYIDTQGNFTKNVLLAIGDNSFTVTATDLKQNTNTKEFTIERKSQQQETVIVNNQTNNTNVLQTGKYYALIIGNNLYQDNAISSLDEPINDATKLYNVLTSQYTFAPQNVTLLKNASYVQMIDAFDNLSNTLTENDNLLVFYAGHGWWDDEKNLGYWLPTNAKKNSTAFWIRNSTISDYMSSIKSKHTLLIADACFSGSIFKTRSAFADAQPAINKLYELPSKKAMTSGNLTEVPDKSVFLQFLVKRLNDNTEKYISSDMLFASFRIAVLNNSPTEPQYGTIQNAGDEGGEFIFIRK